ncbi:MAG: NAD(P)H-hydrate dehydratase [Candidatus Eisenbacteria bacterium]|nr:NAD(P)H-hydrate dehydratase [Candidatus Eisenbacteria bacterium]
MYLLCAAEMRECDRRTIETHGVPGPTLMERAGEGIYREIRRRFDRLNRRRIWIVCGRGNNGGDGLVLARLLHDAGYNPRVFVLGPPEKAGADARLQIDPLIARGIPLEPIGGDPPPGFGDLTSEDLLIDAILGTGFRGRLEPELARLIREMNRSRATIVAVDIPSGLSADTGAIEGEAIHARLTVTMGFPKRSFVFWPARGQVGEWVAVDIGIPSEVMEEVAPAAELIAPSEVAASIPFFPGDAHKGVRGRLVIAGGSPGLTGAPALAALAALRAGAGLVRVATPRSLNPILEAKLTEPMTFPMEETEARTLSPKGVRFLRSLASEWDALVLGPGLGRNRGTDRLVRDLYASWEGPLLVDADGLNALAAGPLPASRAGLPARVLTPHPGEMARLTATSIREILADPIGTARSFASRHGVVLVLKGAPTVIAGPRGPALVNTTGNPGLATGGSGDVLSGIIGTLLAQRLEPLSAAMCGVHLHGLAADLLASEGGERVVAPAEVAERLPAAWRTLPRLRGRDVR